ncbi:MAG TPA: LacI family DNA-binding transcriptional regulator [Armatimonadota bacterium]|jgi:LacI family transcriptional regulator
MVSVRQIAQLANVSPSTASRVLRNASYVRPEIRQRVLAIAKLHHYTPPRMSPEVAGAKTIKIACLMPSVCSDFFGKVLEAILEETSSAQYQIIIVQTHHQLEQFCAAILRMIEQQVDGVLILSGHIEDLPNTPLMALWSHNIVPVLINDDRLPVDCVLTDEHQLGGKILDYLRGLGHRHIGYAKMFGAQVGVDRSTRFQQLTMAAKRLGIEPIVRQYDNDCDDVISSLLTDPAPPTALVTSGTFATMFLQRAALRGVRIPQDISLVGYDNQSFIARLAPQLTTIEQHPHEIGRRAVELLLRRIAEGHTARDFTPEVIHVPSELVIRQTCAKPRSTRTIVPKRSYPVAP